MKAYSIGDRTDADKGMEIVWARNGKAKSPGTKMQEGVSKLARAMKQNDAVNSPNHYTQGERETIENIRDTMSSEGYQGYCVGNVVKYLARYKFKNGVEDVRKAKKYIEFLEEELMKQEG